MSRTGSNLISVILDRQVKEMTQVGWKKTISADKMLSGGYKTTYDTSKSPATTSIQFKEDQLPDKLWRDPLEQTIILKPNCLANDFYHEPDYSGDHITKSQLNLKDGAWRETPHEDHANYGTAVYGSLLSTTYTPSVGTLQIANDKPVPTIAPPSFGSRVWAMETKFNLEYNQGFYCAIPAIGFSTNQYPEIVGFEFGDEYSLSFGHDGIARLYRWNTANNGWDIVRTVRVSRARSAATYFSLSLMVLIYNGAIHFYFDEQRGDDNAIDIDKDFSDVSKYHRAMFRPKVTYDYGLKDWPVTKSAPLRVYALDEFHHKMNLAKITFPSGAQTTYLQPDWIPELKNATPTVTAVANNPGASTTNVSIIDGQNLGAWDPSSSRFFIALASLTRDPAKNWVTPCFTGLNVEYKEQFSDANGAITEQDASADWQSINIRWDLQPGPQECKVVFTEKHHSFSNFYHRSHVPGEVLVSVSGTPTSIFRGYCEEPEFYRPTSPLDTVFPQMTFLDGWARLEGQKNYFLGLDTQNHVEAVRAILNACGFHNDYLQLDPDPYQLPTSSQVNDWLFNETAEGSPADVLRKILRLTGWDLYMQGQKWFYKAPIRCGTPTKYIYLDSADYKASGYPLANRTFAFGLPRRHNQRMGFTHLTVAGPTSKDGNSNRVQTSDFNPDWNTFGKDDFAGILLPETEVEDFLVDQATCNRYWRVLYDRFGHNLFRYTIKGLWKAGFMPNTIVQVLDSGNVDLGVWRIDEVPLEIRHDRDYTYAAEYSLTKIKAA